MTITFLSRRKLGNRRVPNGTHGGVRGRGGFYVSPSYSIDAQAGSVRIPRSVFSGGMPGRIERFRLPTAEFFYRFSAQLFRESALASAGKRIPASTSAPVISRIRAGASGPIPLPPEVANGTIFFPEKS